MWDIDKAADAIFDLTTALVELKAITVEQAEDFEMAIAGMLDNGIPKYKPLAA